ncbi:protein FAM32A [Athalia rosae]|uniref:protein FAM32A n=1 Tax=Athalia rosae TaxID=37344 RepID=UPI000626DB12|nr:protein FAM32A [Athalia rosae]
MSENSTNDEYAHVSKGPLKLKCDSAVVKKKKKKKQKEQKTIEMAKIIDEEKSKSVDLKRTKAELAFQKMQEKMQTERIKQKASMTHKQRVEEFNRHLDSLTEHFDIPKVSWTK